MNSWIVEKKLDEFIDKVKRRLDEFMDSQQKAG